MEPLEATAVAAAAAVPGSGPGFWTGPCRVQGCLGGCATPCLPGYHGSLTAKQHFGVEPLDATAVATAAAVPGSGPGSGLDLVVLRPVCLVTYPGSLTNIECRKLAWVTDWLKLG